MQARKVMGYGINWLFVAFLATGLPYLSKGSLPTSYLVTGLAAAIAGIIMLGKGIRHYITIKNQYRNKNYT